MLPKTGLDYIQYEEVDVEISENVYNANCTPKYFFVKRYFESWDPKIHGPRNYLQIFMWPLSFINAGPISIIHLQCLETVYIKRQDCLMKGTINDGTPSSSSYSEMASKI